MQNYVLCCYISFLIFIACLSTDSIASRYQSHHYGGYTLGNTIFSRSQSYGAINQDGSNGSGVQEQRSHPTVGIFWRFVGWLLLYGSLVVLLKYGSQ